MYTAYSQISFLFVYTAGGKSKEGGSIEGENEVRYSLISNIFLVVVTHHIIYSIIGHPECH